MPNQSNPFAFIRGLNEPTVKRLNQCLKTMTMAEAFCRVFFTFNETLQKYEVSDYDRRYVFRQLRFDFAYDFRPIFYFPDQSAFTVPQNLTRRPKPFQNYTR